jgi:YidC/Oxa1 family membrane protein insertase
MDMQRAIVAVALSFLILFGYQYFFAPPVVPPATQEVAQVAVDEPVSAPVADTTEIATPTTPVASQVTADPSARDITIETPLYTAVVNEQGGGFKSFVLKQYRQEKEEDSAAMELVHARGPAELPMVFSLDNGAGTLPRYTAASESLALAEGAAPTSLAMTAQMADGTVINRTMVFHSDNYQVDISYSVVNQGGNPVQISPALTQSNEPFSHGSTTSRYLFKGPTAYVNDQLHQIKGKKLEDGPQTLQGNIGWTGYMDNYFISVAAPGPGAGQMVTLTGNEEHVRTVLSAGIKTLAPQEQQEYQYTTYIGPKKLTVLKQAGAQFEKAINYGWFDVLAKPMLYGLNFFHTYTGNYGIAIILLTVLIKLFFWPITQKGMKSMKNMQKLQPKMAKLREKFKDDPTRMNQEVMALYRTYKVNPLGGCLPMIIQIPFFFALYRVLMAAIELRHAPFMLWINDLSSPDRLFIGFDIPFLHGLPVLTLLMGASMYLQQKMTPTTADPTQARIMQFLPLVFTFMFINFASGLVLYWFVNNLLSILQQYLINRQIKASTEQ